MCARRRGEFPVERVSSFPPHEFPVQQFKPKLHTLSFEYQRNASRNDNLGIGDQDLPERGYTLDQSEQIFRVAETGTLFKRYFSETRFQARAQRLDYSPAAESPTVVVNNSFTRGGAQGSLSMETQLFERVRLMADYQFQRGTHLLRGRNVNAPVPGAGRPDPSVGNVTQIESSGNSSLHRVMVHMSPAMLMIGRGWFWNVAYRWSRQTSDTDGPFTLPADNFDLRGERGPSAQDVRHFFSAMVNRQIVRNLNLMVVASGSSARPYNVTTGRDDNNDTVFTDRPAGVGRNSARGDARFDVMARVAYGFDFGGKRKDEAVAGGGGPRVIRMGAGGMDGLPSAAAQKYRPELFVSASNLFNHANLAGYSGVETSPYFGRATSALPGRRVEAGLRFQM